MNILEYLDSKKISYKGLGQEKQANCPFCSDTGYHLCINSVKDVYHCVKCGESGNIWLLKQRYGDTTGVVKVPTKVVPQKNSVTTGQLKELNTDAFEFLNGERGLTAKTADFFRLKMKDDYIAIPYYENGDIVNIKYRHIKEKKYIRETGGKSTLFNIDNIDKTQDLVLVEGELDCMAAWQMGYPNVISTSVGASGFKDEWLDFFDQCIGNVYIAYDNDDQGEKGAGKVAERIGKHRCSRVKLPHKDFNECLVKGVTGTQLKTYFVNAIDYKPDNLLHVVEGMGRLADYIQNGSDLTGIKLNEMPALMDFLGGIREAEITVITGETGSGKTTWGLNIIRNLTNSGERALIVSSEMSVISICGKLCSMELGAPYYNVSEEKLQEAMRTLSEKFLFFIDVHGALDADAIGDYLKFVKHKYDVKFALLDHLHYFLRPVDNMVQETEIFMRKLVQISLETKMGLFLIAHPSKLNNDKGIVRMNDIKGASSIKQDCSNVITIWRDKELEEETNPLDPSPPVVFKLEKIRNECGKLGVFKMNFDVASQRYSDIFTGAIR